ncbi:HupE/UreJ family protein [Vibrio astriarenae]|uniref:HupE/UreJ family protein n=1 Tax=Vibrio astriarenae TaxID=1481923 RepID=UPI003736241D
MKYLFLCFLMLPSLAFAHSGDIGVTGSFSSGFIHPFIGLDHFLAMFCIGAISAQRGGTSVWAVPGLFIVFMMIGFILGYHDYNLPFFEPLIAFSVLLFAIIMKYPTWSKFNGVILVLVMFGVSHGYAHGVAVSALFDPQGFQKGFIIASVLIHIVGVVFGLVPKMQSNVAKTLYSYSPYLVAVAGIGFIFQSFSYV